MSPDQNTLYVGDQSGQMQKVGLKPDGSLDGAPTNFGNNVGWTDGLAMDCAGNVYITGGSGVHVLGAANGADLGTITVEG